MLANTAMMTLGDTYGLKIGCLNQKIKEYPPRLSSGWISFLKRLMFAGFSRGSRDTG